MSTKKSFGRGSSLAALRWSDPLSIVGAIVGVFYLAVVFPLCFFRHDDWWILGNSVLHLPKDWGFLWRPTLFHHAGELVWFFRPFFKLGTYLFYQAFGFQYYFWVLGLFLLFVATVWLTHRSLLQFAGPVAARTFSLFFICSIPLHIGSLAWVGEGMMNIPQAFLLMTVLATWFRLASENTFRWGHPQLWLGFVAFVLAIGFKESTVFHLALMGGVLLSERSRFAKFSTSVAYGLPFAVAAAIYLYIRLGWMPLNPSYRPEFSLQLWALSLGKFLSVPMACAFLWIALDAGSNAKQWKLWGSALKKRAAWAPYFAVSIVVYLGQDFFSPGWWYLPSLSLALLMGLCQAEVGQSSSISPKARALALVAFSLSLCVWNFNRIGWWHWGTLQKQVHQMVREADPTAVRVISFYTCTSESFPEVPLVRVIGDPEAIRNQWHIVHGVPVQVNLRYCEHLAQDLRGPASVEGPVEAVFQWEFPQIKALGENARRLERAASVPAHK
jgi:hypothetical protein